MTNHRLTSKPLPTNPRNRWRAEPSLATEAAPAVETPAAEITAAAANHRPSTRPRCRAIMAGSRRRPAAASAALHVADGCRRPLLARLGRIHPPDRRPYRRQLRPAVERDRRSVRARSGRARSEKAFATRDTWSGITLNWPVDGGERLPVELSGLPMFDRARNFAGYRGFGVCRDLEAWPGSTRCAALNSSAIRQPRRFPPTSRKRDRGEHAGLRRPICRPASLNYKRQLKTGIHNKPIWKSPWKSPRTFCHSGRSASRNRPR